MWNKYKSLAVSYFIVIALAVLTVVAAFFIPYLVGLYCQTIETELVSLTRVWLISTLYTTLAPAIVAELCLYKLLDNVKKDTVFVPENVRYLRVISWCCFIVAVLYFVLGFRILLGFAIAAAAGFFGLIVRVIKNVFYEAVVIKSENDLTI